VTVEEEGVRRWLSTQHDPQLERQFDQSERYREDFTALVERTRAKLSAIYSSDSDDATKLKAKAAAFAAMRAQYALLKQAWRGSAAYDSWFAQGPNNASVAAVGLYTQKVPQFQALLAADGGDLPRFYAQVKVLSALPKGERETALPAAAAPQASLLGSRDQNRH